MQNQPPILGFIGLGVMGSPMCRNMVTKHAATLHAFDVNAAAVDEVRQAGAIAAGSVADVAAAADIVFLSLPGGKQMLEVCFGEGGIARARKPGTIVIDLSTTSVADARHAGAQLAEAEMLFADAPVARTRQAAQAGTLSIMVGADEKLFAKIEPLLRYIGSDVTRCGETGCGQVVKLINNTLLFEHVAALAEMMVVAERAGVTPETLLHAVSMGSGDSFALRNHGMKSMVPRNFPERAFPSHYVLKDLGYSMELAESCGVAPKLAAMATQYYRAAVDQGIGDKYFPAIIELVGKGDLQ